MIKLIMFPDFPFKAKISEGGKYYVLYCANTYVTTVLEMECSTLRWAIQDVEVEMKDIFDSLFGINNWGVLFTENISSEFIEKHCTDNDIIPEYHQKRRQFHLPPWNEGKDKYRC